MADSVHFGQCGRYRRRILYPAATGPGGGSRSGQPDLRLTTETTSGPAGARIRSSRFRAPAGRPGLACRPDWLVGRIVRRWHRCGREFVLRRSRKARL